MIWYIILVMFLLFNIVFLYVINRSLNSKLEQIEHINFMNAIDEELHSIQKTENENRILQ